MGMGELPPCIMGMGGLPLSTVGMRGSPPHPPLPPHTSLESEETKRT